MCLAVENLVRFAKKVEETRLEEDQVQAHTAKETLEEILEEERLAIKRTH